MKKQRRPPRPDERSQDLRLSLRVAQDRMFVEVNMDSYAVAASECSIQASTSWQEGCCSILNMVLTEDRNLMWRYTYQLQENVAG